MPACQKDDLFIFESGGVYKTDEGATKCDPTDPQQTTGTWVFNSGETMLTTVEGGDTVTVTITELSSSKLVGTQSDSTGTITMTLGKN
jgi:hypothetical protein